MSDKPPFVDSNIWLYALIDGTDDAKSKAARDLTRGIHSVVSLQVVHEVCANLLRKAKFEETGIRQVITAFYRGCTVVEITEGTLRAASALREGYRFSYWDSTVLASALEAGVEAFWSEDMQDGLLVEGRLRIVNPLPK